MKAKYVHKYRFQTTGYLNVFPCLNCHNYQYVYFMKRGKW